MDNAAQTDARLRKRLVAMILASAVMGICVWFAIGVLSPWLYGPGRGWALLVLVLFGAAVYFGVGGLIGAFRLSDFKSAMRRGK